MTPLDTYRALLARVEAATGADRELDDRIAMRVAGLRPTITLGDEILGNLRDVPAHSPRYTASLDAALALVERLGGRWEVSTPGRPSATVWIDDDPKHTRCGNGATPALALLAALLTALIAQEEAQP